MQLGKLTFNPIKLNDALVSKGLADTAYASNIPDSVYVAEIDDDLADTEVFCEQYGIELALSTNCLIVEAKRGDRVWYAACLILATDMADVNGAIRRHIDARKVSFASKDTALRLTHMEYGGITPIGLPDDWVILVDEAVLRNEVVVIGGGLRRSKIAVKTSALLKLGNVEVVDIKKTRL